jgi:uncharacterized membrane protein YoaK (UPF0700 family)
VVAGARTQASLWPWAGSGFGPLPPLLVAMTVVTGVVDAVSYLALGHVFVANMTGNVVFLGFALAGAGGLSVPASLVALAAFVCGAAAGGRIGARFGDRRSAHLRAANSVTATLLVAAAVLAAIAGQPPSSWLRYVLVAAMALAMGVQNAMARSLAVPDLTTTVLTMTLTGIAADPSVGIGSGRQIGRRLIAVGAMLGGALVGALLVTHVDIALPLAIAAALLVTTRLVAQLRRP